MTAHFAFIQQAKIRLWSSYQLKRQLRLRHYIRFERNFDNLNLT